MKSETFSYNFNYYCSQSHVVLFTSMETHDYKSRKPTIVLSLEHMMSPPAHSKFENKAALKIMSEYCALFEVYYVKRTWQLDDSERCHDFLTHWRLGPQRAPFPGAWGFYGYFKKSNDPLPILLELRNLDT